MTAPAGGGTVRWSDGGGFGVSPLWLLEAEISDRSKVLYARLAAHAGAGGSTLRGHAEMEKWLRCGRTAVKTALAELHDLGAITVEETTTESGGRGRNAYVVHAVCTSRGGDETPRRGGDLLPIRDPEELETEEGKPSSDPGVAVATVERVGVELPWGPTRVGGRDLPFDALQREAHIMAGSPRTREIPSALNGAGRNRAPGIRALAWAEAPPLARQNPQAWETWLGEEIPRRAAAYRAAMPGATLTPMALAKWWVDVRSAPVSASESAYEVAMDEMRRMEEGR